MYAFLMNLNLLVTPVYEEMILNLQVDNVCHNCALIFWLHGFLV